MKIQIQNEFAVPTRKVSPRKESCHYMQALYSTLVHLKPRTCLEIGTNTGNTARVFQKYFDNYCPDGVLVTCDIKKYSDLSLLKNVRQIIVSHHSENVSKLHPVRKEDLAFNYSDSVRINVGLIKDQFLEYDFAFIDGDHTRDSFLKDIEICNSVLRAPKYTLIDDTKEPVHDCMRVYEEEIKKNELYECYDFEDWDRFVGCSLVYRRQ